MIYNILSFTLWMLGSRNAHARTIYKGLNHNKVTKFNNEKQIFSLENRRRGKGRDYRRYKGGQLREVRELREDRAFSERPYA